MYPKSLITKDKLAYKIGFASALSLTTMSVYSELAKWTTQSEKMKDKFIKGYKDGVRQFRDVCNNNVDSVMAIKTNAQ